MTSLFEKILIANRGEIAIRIIEACQEMGIKTIAVYSDIDQRAMHVSAADEAHPLGDPLPQNSYLNIDKIIDIAQANGAEAIHPGYGFLSENPDFAARCLEEGLVFIGPKSHVIRAMGHKIEANQCMKEAGIPTIPGYHSQNTEEDMDFLLEKAKAIGFPVMIKATAGGGGRGIRIVDQEKEFAAAYDSAFRETKAAFGDGSLFLEKYIVDPRHIEFQILADEYGHIIHLFERECSIQRRYQKVIEETPSVVLTPELREKMGKVAVAAARAAGYTNAGTVEFIFAPDKTFYFLEMNTRLQVEHAITEATTGIDLVKWQIKLAAGIPLTLKQEEIVQRGHAIECRIYAEDPSREFLPSAGRVHQFRLNLVDGIGIRNDKGITSGSEVSTYYESLLSKLIVYSENREESLQKMAWALANYAIIGVQSNVEFLRTVLAHEKFRQGEYSTQFLEKYFKDWEPPKPVAPPEAILAASVYDILETTTTNTLSNYSNAPGDLELGWCWKHAGNWGRESLTNGGNRADGRSEF
ncbi:MAG: acetyl/propionyl/methylcrotonyl-CoA carboxylase subunit alpha [Candidatus Heimdallarchaeota archaeon]